MPSPPHSLLGGVNTDFGSNDGSGNVERAPLDPLVAIGGGGDDGGDANIKKGPLNPLVSETVHDKKAFMIFSPLPVGPEPL